MSTAPPNVSPDVKPDPRPSPQAEAPAKGGPLASKVRHRLMLRDAMTFLTLSALTVVLFAATLILFRSFTAHQQSLARQWSERGRTELAERHPEEAVTSLRTALTYAPGERSEELLLAQALGDAGHTEESYTYFTSLWDRTPGDGLINLRLARLAAIKGEREEAVNFYRASIFGTWPGDAILRRREVRLELAQFLIAQKQFAPAREELRIAGSNAGQDPDLDRHLSQLLVSANDPRDALDYDLKALAGRPEDVAATVAAARLSDEVGNTPQALRLTDRALHLLSRQQPETSATIEAAQAMRTLRSSIERLQQLDPAESLPSAERARRILFDAALARLRLVTCLANSGGTSPAATLAGLVDQWSGMEPALNAKTLPRQHDAQNAAIRLIDTTETATSLACGPPTGDDALLLRLAQQHTWATDTAVPQPAHP